MNVQLNFEKKTVSLRLYKYLTANMPEEGDRKSISRLMNKKKLAYHEANQLIQGLLSAMIMEDVEGEEEEETEITPDTDGETDSQRQTQTQREEESSGSQTQTQEGTQNEKPDFSKVCKFYRNGDCKFGAKCRQEHPKFCKKFVKHGLKRHNQAGCDSKCGKLHPNACRTSLRTKECDREKCKFFHIRGTVKISKKDPEGGWSEREKERWREESRRNEARHLQGEETRNEARSKDQVFLESHQAMIQMIARLNEKMDLQMEELKGWVTQKPQHTQLHRFPQRSHPPREDHWASQ